MKPSEYAAHGSSHQLDSIKRHPHDLESSGRCAPPLAVVRLDKETVRRLMHGVSGTIAAMWGTWDGSMTILPSSRIVLDLETHAQLLVCQPCRLYNLRGIPYKFHMLYSASIVRKRSHLHQCTCREDVHRVGSVNSRSPCSKHLVQNSATYVLHAAA